MDDAASYTNGMDGCGSAVVSQTELKVNGYCSLEFGAKQRHCFVVLYRASLTLSLKLHSALQTYQLTMPDADA